MLLLRFGEATGICSMTPFKKLMMKCASQNHNKIAGVAGHRARVPLLANQSFRILSQKNDQWCSGKDLTKKVPETQFKY